MDLGFLNIPFRVLFLSLSISPSSPSAHQSLQYLDELLHYLSLTLSLSLSLPLFEDIQERKTGERGYPESSWISSSLSPPGREREETKIEGRESEEIYERGRGEERRRS